MAQNSSDGSTGRLDLLGVSKVPLEVQLNLGPTQASESIQRRKKRGKERKGTQKVSHPLEGGGREATKDLRGKAVVGTVATKKTPQHQPHKGN